VSALEEGLLCLGLRLRLRLCLRLHLRLRLQQAPPLRAGCCPRWWLECMHQRRPLGLGLLL
jgi:hypothetical protein